MTTIWDLALHRGIKLDDDGSANADQFHAVGLAMIGGCVRCEATIAAYNACPTKTGFWMCKDCVGGDGFNSCEECEEWITDQHQETNSSDYTVEDYGVEDYGEIDF
jgi:hypothetical protein